MRLRAAPEGNAVRRIIIIEDENHDRQRLCAGALLLLAGLLPTLAAMLRGELFAQAETRQPLSVLDVMRSSRLPGVRVTRESCIILSGETCADGFEIAASWRGSTWTCRVGQVKRLIASRDEYLRHYGARSLPAQGAGRKAA
jgi:hypothetical protein